MNGCREQGAVKLANPEALPPRARTVPALQTCKQMLRRPCQAQRRRYGLEASRARPQKTSWDTGEGWDFIPRLIGSLWKFKQAVLNLIWSLKGLSGGDWREGFESGIAYSSRRPRLCQVTQEHSLAGVMGLYGNRGENRSRCVCRICWRRVQRMRERKKSHMSSSFQLE